MEAEAGARAPDYERSDVVAALRAVGIEPGSVVLSHTSVGMLGRPAEGLSKDALFELFTSAFTEVLGPSGTLVLPAFSYSYTSGETFDPVNTPPGTMGLLTEMLWQQPGVRRSLDPIFSVIALGARADELTAGIPAECFGDHTIWSRLLEADALVCNIGIGSHSTFIHHVEQKAGVGYRYLKRFGGVTIVDGEPIETEIDYLVRDLDSTANVPYFMRLDRDGRADGSVRAARVGRGEVNAIPIRRMEELIRSGLAADPEYLIRGAKA